MSLVQTTPPALEPVSLAEVKAHLRIDTSSEDLLLATLIATARQHIERALGMALISQSWSLFLDRWPGLAQPLALPLTPVLQLNAVRFYGADGTISTRGPSEFQLDPGPPPRVARLSGGSAPVALRTLAAIEIAFVAGFGALPSNVPQALRHGLLQLVAHLQTHRGLEPDDSLPPAIADLLSPWRRPRLQ